MTQAIVVLILTLSLSWLGDMALGQRRVEQNRVQTAAQQRRERRQAELLVEEGVKLLKAGKKVMAVEKFNRALQLNPQNDQAHVYLAQVAWNDQRAAIAKHHVTEALKYNPENVRAHLLAGQIFFSEGKSLAAYDHWRKAAAKAADEQDKRELGKWLVRLREKQPTLFGNIKTVSSTNPPSTQSAKPAPGPTTNIASTTPSPAPAKGVRPNLAVFTFEEISPQRPEQGWGASLAEMLSTALINAGSYRLVERKQLQKVLEEQALGQSGALDFETAVVVGRIMSIDAIVVGSISALTNAVEADARILNVETGEAIAATHSRAASADQLRQIAEALATEINQHAAMVPVRAMVDSSANSTLKK